MKASVGDRLVTASSVVDGPVRDGRVLELRHPDGSPPYLVEWSDTGERTLLFPGPDTHVEHYDAGDVVHASAPPAALAAWSVQVTIQHDGGRTTAHAVLAGGAPSTVSAVGEDGHATRSPDDPEAPVVGDEIAVARALRRLADRLVLAAESQIEQSTGRRAHVHR
ncbi:DUF1918 domain-containing protein [Actinotalea sp. C106]|uniref:DUF1918 domain-containing protein n=1 Tax=Actinotalea sp. C106 TaxID=2908644 RepID=UPI002028CE11|nr:DUF1918 domain-containing protein [Actinotalea sp. C106]